jgi:hypothetical protein
MFNYGDDMSFDSFEVERDVFLLLTPSMNGLTGMSSLIFALYIMWVTYIAFADIKARILISTSWVGSLHHGIKDM